MNDGQVVRTAQDLIGRFTPTPLGVDVTALGRRIHLETNSSVILRWMRRALPESGPGETVPAPAAFCWKLVSDPAAAQESPWPPASIVADDGLRYSSFGQSSFVAVDLASREAVGFVAEPLTRDEAAFKETVLAALFSMTADALGVTAFRGAMVSLAGKAILVVGTRPSANPEFLNPAEEPEVELPAGDTTFLELAPGGLQAWAGFPPARVAALAGSVVVEHGPAGVAALDPLPPSRLAERLRPYLLFANDHNFAAQHDHVLRALVRLPAYSLTAGHDPANASRLIGTLLQAQSAGKVRA